MRILYVGVVQANFWGGGEPIVSNNMVIYLRKGGNQVVEDYYLSPLGNIKYIKGLSRFLRTFIYLSDIHRKAVKHYVMKIKMTNPDIIIAQYDYDTSIIEAAKLCNKKIIIYVHIYWPICPKLSLLKSNNLICKGFIQNKCRNCILSSSSRLEKLIGYPLLRDKSVRIKMDERIKKLNYENVTVVTLNERMKELFAECGVRKDKIVVISNGVDSNFFKYSDKERERAICYLGGQDKNKGYETFLKIAEEIHRQNEKIQIYATGNFSTELILKYRYISFTGYIERDKLVLLLQSCKCVIVPSLWEEPCIAVAIEAALTGAVVVGSNIINLKNIIEDNISGFIVDVDDVSSFVHRISEILNNDNLFYVISHEARLRAQRYASVKTLNEKWNNLLHEMVTREG